MADEVKPYRIAVSDSAIELLNTKLGLATFPDEVDFSDDPNYGATSTDVKRLVGYWKDGFNWRTQEQRLNKMPQYTTTIAVDGFDDLQIHFVHQRSSNPGSIPLLFCHGWPGSFIEVTKILSSLTESSNGLSFHVVAPSLPNFGFSDAVSKRGFGIPQYAECLHKIMLRLGYDKYVTQGGDWGFFITRLIAAQYPEHCLASHINFVCVKPSFASSLWLGLQYVSRWYSEKEKEGLARTGWYVREGSGYMVQQSTKPSTLGFAMADSPIALLAWVYEKLRDWTDEYPWTDDEILTWVSIYQFSTAGPAASMRIYYEASHASREQFIKSMQYVPRVPLGISYYPKDLLPLPKSCGRTLGPIVFEIDHDRGGHFAAYECPDQFVGDLKVMFSKGGGGHQAVKEFL